MLLLCNREDVATSEEIVITADVTDTSSLSVTLLVTDNSQKTEVGKQFYRNLEIFSLYCFPVKCISMKINAIQAAYEQLRCH